MSIVDAEGVAESACMWIFVASQSHDAATVWPVFGVVEEDESRVEADVPYTDVECWRDGNTMMPCVRDAAGEKQPAS